MKYPLQQFWGSICSLCCIQTTWQNLVSMDCIARTVFSFIKIFKSASKHRHRSKTPLQQFSLDFVMQIRKAHITLHKF